MAEHMVSFYHDKKGEIRRYLPSEFAQIYQERSPEAQWAINEKLTTAHSNYEMTFQVKDPETGKYDKIVSVDSNGLVIPFPEGHFSQLVDSSGPLLRSLRDLLQKIYSLPPSEWTPKKLNLSHVPLKAFEEIIAIIKGNIYYEEKYTDSSLKDYPFLPVVGFDAAISDPETIDPVFFEYNSGTPSGITNNIQLLEELKKIDPEIFQSLLPYIKNDSTFKTLREIIERNAFAWTNYKNGISVIIGPGEFNAAHPDVASISLFTGMPLVQKEDLYLGIDGFVHLNTGKESFDPIVTGIYSRSDESFILQSIEEGIPAKDPGHKEINEELSERLNLKLKPGVLYDYEYDEEGDIIDVGRDSEGNPRLMKVYGSFGKNPLDPKIELNLLKLIKEKRIYLSCLGGRTVDDKKIFDLAAHYLAPNFRRNEKLNKYASPPLAIEEDESIDEFLKLEDFSELKKYVVKATDSSGGDKVYIFKDMKEESIRDVMTTLKEDPSRWLIQEFKPVARGQGVSKDRYFFPQVVDLRIFVMMDEKGDVFAPHQSILLRVASENKSKTNTSAGGGYGILVVLSDDKVKDYSSFLNSLLPIYNPITYLPHSKRVTLDFFIQQWSSFIHRLTMGYEIKDSELDLFRENHRSLMDVLGRDYSPLMSLTRHFGKGRIKTKQYLKELERIKSDLLDDEFLPYMNLAPYLKVLFSNFLPLDLTKKLLAPVSEEEREEFVEIREDKSLEKIIRRYKQGDEDIERHITGELVAIDHLEITKILSELKSEKGRLLIVEDYNKEKDEWTNNSVNASFYVADNGIPLIYANVHSPYFLSSLKHEMVHFKNWRDKRNDFLAQGFSQEEASRFAREFWAKPENKLKDEEMAVREEMKGNLVDDEVFNRGWYSPITDYYEIGYFQRAHYPYVEALRSSLHLNYWNMKDKKEGFSHWEKEIMKEVIVKAVSYRREFLTHYDNKKTNYHFAFMLKENIFQLIFKFDLYQFQTDKTYLNLVNLFKEVYKELQREGFLSLYVYNSFDDVILESESWIDDLTKSVFLQGQAQ